MRLLPKAVLCRFFPATKLPDVIKARGWTTIRGKLSVVPWLRMQARLDGLPVEQLDMHTARSVAEDLGLEYAVVRCRACCCRAARGACLLRSVLVRACACIACSGH